jgi:hypothetical protein
MMTFVETPWPAVLTCTVALVVFGVLFMRTGRASMIVAMAAIVGALVGLVVLEQTIVTDTEEVQDTLHGIAEHLAANNVPEVLAAFAPNCPGLAQARPVLSRVTVESATIGRDLEVRISKLTSPASATAFFTGRIQAKDNSGTIPYEHYIRKFKVKLERHGDRWLIADYEDLDPRSKDSGL